MTKQYYDLVKAFYEMNESKEQRAPNCGRRLCVTPTRLVFNRVKVMIRPKRSYKESRAEQITTSC